MRTPFRSRILAALGTCALLASGCGGGGEPVATEAVSAGAGTGTTAVGDSGNEATDTGGAATVTIHHAQGETEVPRQPETVVTFDLGVLDSLDAMGVEVAGVPEVASLPERLEAYGGDEVVKVGTLFEPDYERVNALDPDLIIVAGRSSAVYDQLAELAPTIDLTVDGQRFLPSFRDQLASLGEIFDRADWVEEQLAELDRGIGTVQELAARAGDALILLTSGGEVAAYGPGSRFGIIHDVFGVTPAVEDVEAATHGDAVSFEFVLEADPDHLFVLDRDAAIGESGEAAEVVLDNELVARTTAWQEGDVHYLDGVTWYLVPSGLRSLQTMIAEVEEALA